MKLGRILHPTDFSDCANHALGQAVELAVSAGAQLHLFHAIALHTDDPAHLDQQLDAYLKSAEARANETLTRRLEDVKGRGLDVSIEVSRDVTPFDGIMHAVESTEPDLLVVGTHGRTGLGRLLMGSVAEKVLRHVPQDVLSLSQDAPIIAGKGPQKLLVPVDFSGNARKAVDEAREWAEGSGGAITLVHVIEPLHPVYFPGGVSSRVELDPELPERSRAKLLEWIAPSAAEILIREGSAGHEIVRAAAEIGADGIVMGSRGLTGLDHVMLGSVAEKVVRTAKVPVLIVK